MQRTKGSFKRGVLSIAGGTVVGQGISVLASPILTRLYTPQAMGMWGLFVSFVGVAAVGGALRYEVAIVAAQKEDDAYAIAGHALLLSVITSSGGGAIFEAFRRNGILGYDAFPWWMGGFVVLAIAVNTWGQVLRFWFVRRKGFQLVGYFVAGRGFSRALAQIFLSSWRSAGLICGEVVGRLVSLGLLLRDFPLREVLKVVLLRRHRNTLQKFKEYPLVFLPSAFVDTLAMMAPVPVFTSVYGIEVGGMLALAQRVASVPLIFLGGAVADVFFGEIAEVTRYNPKKANSLFLKSTFGLGIISLFIGAGLWMIAPWGVRVVFGAKWVFTGRMLEVMVPWFVAMFTVSPISRLVFLSRYPWAKLVYDFLALMGMTVPLWLYLPDPLEALRLVAWIQAMLYGVYWLVLFVAVRQGLEGK